jgi:small subunit ribosomal protein S20
VPTIKSTKKRMRQSAKRRVQNRTQRATVRTAVKRVRQAETAEQAELAFHDAERQLDRAARKGLVPKNTAARQKQRLRKMIQRKAG